MKTVLFIIVFFLSSAHSIFSQRAEGMFFADVDGDGKTDAVAVSERGIVVFRSKGGTFSASGELTPWTGPFPGTQGMFFADVDGDGKADAVSVNERGIIVFRSRGGTFRASGEFTPWTGPFPGKK